jgi:hypothetical protein
MAFMFAIYARGHGIAVTSDGLIVQLPGLKNAPIPWTKVRCASVRHQRIKDEGYVASIRCKGWKMKIRGTLIGFQTPEARERFIEQVNARVASAGNNDSASLQE